jgi:type VI secretion system protein ImpG
MDELLECYKDELSAFHGAADEFSRVYPRVAGQLRLGATGADDPHVERLIQAFAFLTARVFRISRRRCWRSCIRNNWLPRRP